MLKFVSFAGATLALGLLAAPAQAAPTTGLIGADAKPDTTAQQVHRRCWRHRGHWHCEGYSHRRYRSYGYGPGVYLNFVTGIGIVTAGIVTGKDVCRAPLAFLA
jgi:hypothetical protein